MRFAFDGSGQCIEQPAEKESFAEKVRIHSYPTEEYLGMIFVYFGAGAPLTQWNRSERIRQLISYSHVPDAAHAKV